MATRLFSYQFAFLHSARHSGFVSGHAAACRAFIRLAPRRHASGAAPKVVSPKPSSPSSKLGSIAEKPVIPKLDARFRRFETRILHAKGPLEIFKAPGHRGYMACCYMIGLFCYSYAVWNVYVTVIDARSTLGTIVKYATAGVCVVMGAMGTRFLFLSTNLISSIRAQMTSNGSRLYIRVRRPIPFMKQREIVAKPSELTLSRRLVVSPDVLVADQQWSELQAQLERHRKVEATPLWKAPITKTSFLIWKIFSTIRRVFLQENFAYLSVEGQSGQLRLDLTGTVSQELEILSDFIASE
ncbi:hypothetical protein VTO42DRAFT_859 [Malbranchea cinnamomea]